MNITEEYYLTKYDVLTTLSDTEKCLTVLMQNRDTGELAVKKTMSRSAFHIYSKLKEINNKNIVNVLECFMDGEKCVAIEEYVNGKRLDDYCLSRKLTLVESLKIAYDICAGLEVVHAQGIIHRDVQPRNIIISNEGTLKLIDFDISRIGNKNTSKDTELLGTVGYAAPEQYGFSQTSNRSDIYSVGVVLKELFEQCKDLLKEELKIKDEIQSIIKKCMEMDPQYRYETVTELREILEKLIINIDKHTNQNEDSMKTQTENGMTGREYQEKKQYMEENLPPVSLRYIISTIPGFKSGNLFYMIFAIFMYGLFAYAFGAAAFDFKNISLYRKVIGCIFYELAFIISYMYLTNIAHIAMRCPKMRFENKRKQYIYQIGIAIGILVFFILCADFVLPVRAAK